MAPGRPAWDISAVARSAETKEAERSARTRRAQKLYARLMSLPRPEGLSNNDWARKAGVSTSFFTNLQDGSEPSIHNLRKVLDAIGVTLSEFFLEESLASVTRRPSEQELEQVFRDAWRRRPKDDERIPEFLSATVGRVLVPLLERPDGSQAESSEEDGPPRRTTKRAKRAP